MYVCAFVRTYVYMCVCTVCTYMRMFIRTRMYIVSSYPNFPFLMHLALKYNFYTHWKKIYSDLSNAMLEEFSLRQVFGCKPRPHD